MALGSAAKVHDKRVKQALKQAASNLWHVQHGVRRGEECGYLIVALADAERRLGEAEGNWTSMDGPLISDVSHATRKRLSAMWKVAADARRKMIRCLKSGRCPCDMRT